MRNAFAASITDLAAKDERIVLLSGDIGNRLFDKYRERFPSRFYNCGVAEANMTGMAAGLALSGLRPFTYTITPFATTRVIEQIRVDICYHDVPVVIVGTGSGLSYASLGPTHHSCEDVGILRCFPNLTVLCPADAMEVGPAIEAALTLPGPVYIRLGKKGEPNVHERPPKLEVGRGIVMREGTDVCLLGMGTMTATALEAAKLLQGHGISARVVSMHTVKPLDDALLRESFDRFKVVAVVEEHSVIGGLGSAVAEWLGRRGPQRGVLEAIGTP
ncbi:MAG: transketolase family protein, partial [Planctomycetia bacterium]